MGKPGVQPFQFVKVKLISDNSNEYLIPVKCIYEFKDDPPFDKKQYDSKKIYTAKFKQNNATVTQTHPVKIGGLYMSREESKRGSYSSMSKSIIEAYVEPDNLSDWNTEDDGDPIKKQDRREDDVKSNHDDEDSDGSDVHKISEPEDEDAEQDDEFYEDIGDSESSGEKTKCKKNTKKKTVKKKSNPKQSKEEKEKQKKLQQLQKDQEHQRQLQILGKVQNRSEDYKKMYDNMKDEVESLKLENSSLRHQLEAAYKQLEKDAGTDGDASYDSLRSETALLKQKLEKTEQELQQSRQVLRSIDKLSGQMRNLLQNESSVNTMNTPPKLDLDLSPISEVQIKKNNSNKRKPCESPESSSQQKKYKNFFAQGNETETIGSTEPQSSSTPIKAGSRTSEPSANETHNRSLVPEKSSHSGNRKYAVRYTNTIFLKHSSMEKMKDDTDSMLFLDGFTHDVTGRAMVYIKHGTAIEESEWITLMTQKDIGQFLVLLLDTLYPNKDYVKKCIKSGENVLTPSKKHRRIAFSKKEMDVIGTCSREYIRRSINFSDTIKLKKARDDQYKKIPEKVGQLCRRAGGREIKKEDTDHESD